MSDMNIDQVLSQMRAMKAAATGNQIAANPAAKTGSGVDFSSMLQNSISQVSDVQKTAGGMKRAFINEEPGVGLTEVMVATQRASMSFEAMKQVRNKLVAAYQEVMNMQV
ncbi:MAG: flagellar hook-basal body complex protein FliE [Gammaproteobacteria bacterium]|nr:flagellar hook-basal body complex protein FliE [Gammaproteobacteria bacterium]